VITLVEKFREQHFLTPSARRYCDQVCLFVSLLVCYFVMLAEISQKSVVKIGTDVHCPASAPNVY